MIFSKNETVFPSVIHQAVWNSARLIFPLEKSLSLIKDEAVKIACSDLYNLIIDGYEDIYNNPDIYGLEPADAEDYLSGRVWSKAIILALNKKDQIALDYFKCAEQRLHFFRFICGKFSADNTTDIIYIQDNHVRFSKDGYKKLLSLLKKHHNFDKESFSNLMQRLSFVIILDNDDLVITNTKYPNMFKALKLLKGVDLKQKINKTNTLSTACHFFDFRVLTPDYKCTFEDALYSLDDVNKKELIRLDSFFASLNMKRECKLNHVEWKFKGKKIVKYEGTKVHFDINKSGNANNLITVFINKTWSFNWPLIPPNFGGEKNTENRIIFESAVEKLPNADDIKVFCLKHVKRCRQCGCLYAPPPRGHPKVMFGKIFYTCGGGTNFGVEHLTSDNFNFICDLAKISTEQY
ncbi:MAG: hypothetical protein FWD47_00705 [Treponema sp.]|nr:hypothetical protein [Treponema sp.]